MVVKHGSLSTGCPDRWTKGPSTQESTSSPGGEARATTGVSPKTPRESQTWNALHGAGPRLQKGAVRRRDQEGAGWWQGLGVRGGLTGVWLLFGMTETSEISGGCCTTLRMD